MRVLLTTIRPHSGLPAFALVGEWSKIHMSWPGGGWLRNGRTPVLAGSPEAQKALKQSDMWPTRPSIKRSTPDTVD